MPDNIRRLIMFNCILSSLCAQVAAGGGLGPPGLCPPMSWWWPWPPSSPTQTPEETRGSTQVRSGSYWHFMLFLYFILYTCNLNDNKYGCSRQMDLESDFDLRIGNKIVFNNTNCVNIGSRGIFKSDISFRVGRGILHWTLASSKPGTAFKRSFPKVSPVKSGYMSGSTPSCRL